MKRQVTVIPANETRFSAKNNQLLIKKRVAAYARVSTDNEEQLSSYEAQVDYYTRHIQSNLTWEFVEVYTDEGISGTSIKRRKGFQKMIADALDGKIDLILTKSVSRFARNTVDTLTTVRQLKEKNVEVFFEKENIYTLDSKGELLITIMSSIAQSESESISSNVTWGQRKRFADGKVSLPYKQFLGYEKGEDGLPKIVEKEAQVVRLIYRMFLEGKTPSRLSKYLTEQKIPTPAGKKIWQPSTIKSILKNEKYKGDARLQKTFTVDFLTKKKKINEGEIPQYYVDNSHPAIVTPEVYELVQEEFQRLRAAGSCTSTINCFASRIVCGDCGGFYGRKVWHSNSQYRCTVWHCNNKFHKRKYCSTPTVKEEAVKKAFLEAFNSLIHNKAEILSEYDCIIEEISNMTDLENQCSTLDQQIRILEKEMEGFIAQNARLTLSQKEYNSRYDEYMAEHRRLQEQKQDLARKMTVRKAKKLRMQDFIATLKEQDALLTEFDEKLWSTLLSAMEIVSSTEVIFRFKDGMELPWQIII